MALDITVHDLIASRGGAISPAAKLSVGMAAQTVALGAQSTVINGPATLCLIAGEGQRIALTKTPGYAAPSASGIKLLAGVERWYDIGAGAFYINAVAG